MKTLLSGAVVVTCNESHDVLKPGDVLIEDDRIAFVGPKYEGDYDQKVHLGGYLLMPGLINAHTHSSMTLFRSRADDVDLRTFLQERVWPLEAKLTDEDAYVGSLLSAIEMLKSGVTCYVDMYFFEEGLVRAALDTGIRAVITPGIIEVPGLVKALGHWDQRTNTVIDFCRRWENYTGRIHTGLGPHAPYTLPFEALKEISSEAKRNDLPVHIHLVETKEERDNFNSKGLGSTVGALEEAGFFEAKVISAHSVWIEEGDEHIYARHHTGVAHCPISNAKLGVGVAPINRMLSAGVNVGLGTDSAASNNNLNLWEELKFAPLIAKAVSQNPLVISAEQALWMATRLGAIAIHRSDIGVIANGMKADIIALDIDRPEFLPATTASDYVHHLVYSANKDMVKHVWVNGSKVVENGQLLMLDEAETIKKAGVVAARLLEG